VGLLRQPGAFLPVALSLAALSTVLVHFAVVGTAREPDEGTAAHLWQLLIVAQVPIIGYFAVKWLPREPGQALLILALQAGAALAACAPVWYFDL
jgi:hypothetical protein